LFSYDIGHKWKNRGRTAFENNVLEEGITHFASVLKMTKSGDLLSVAIKGHAFRLYNSTVKQLTFNKCITTSAVAERLILPNMALNNSYNDF